MGETADQDEPLYRLEEAAARFLPKGFTAKSLRTEARHGRLRLTRIAGKDCVTERDIREMREKCRVQPKDQGSTSASAQGDRVSGLSETERMRLAQAAARAAANSPTKNSRNTSNPATAPRRKKKTSNVYSLPTS